MKKGNLGSFAANLRSVRESQGMSQAALADRAAVPFHTVARIERGERTPSLDEALTLCAALGVSIEQLTTEQAKLAIERQRSLDELQSLARQLPTEQIRKVVVQIGAKLSRRKR
jgi:transcriptional regulator with XRE-family HTH domain